jgi:hypothetical protein
MVNRIVAVGLLTQRDLDALGSGFARAFPIDNTPCFEQLLRAIDEADRELGRERDREERKMDSGGQRASSLRPTGSRAPLSNR